MSRKPPTLWIMGCMLLFSGLLGLLVLVILAACLKWPASTWLSLAGNVSVTMFVVGGWIVWWFAMRFCARVSQEISGPRSLGYLGILIGLNWLAPFVFMRLEGRERFFGQGDTVNPGPSSLGVWLALAWCCTASCADILPMDPAVVKAAAEVKPAAVTDQVWLAGLQGGLWNPARTAVAMSLMRPEGTKVAVVIRRADGGYVAVDVSKVETINLGKLGIAGRAKYQRCETTPVEWLPREDGRFQVVLRTQAWRGGQRYTVSERLVIEPTGTVLWR